MTRESDHVSLAVEGIRVGYGGDAIIDGFDVSLPRGIFTVIIGPNACGKSTLLRTLARLLQPSAGQVRLADRDLRDFRAKEFARELTLLPQAVPVPEGISVADLVARGRFPHQGLLRQWSVEDEEAVRVAMDTTAVTDLRNRVVDDLSGGQRQRVLLAMALAQGTEVLLLDEPTTYLDITHQIEVLELCRDLREGGKTVVAVLHDLHLAARYADHLLVMHEGALLAQGTPTEVLTPELIEEAFGLRARVMVDPESGAPLIVPRAGRSALAATSSLRTAPREP